MRRDVATGRRLSTRLKDWERADVLALRKAGHTVEQIGEMLDRGVNVIRRVLAEEVAKQYTDETCQEYVATHLMATKIAAANGDAGPAMDMMDRLGLVPATSRERVKVEVAHIAAAGQAAVTAHLHKQTGPTINIGIGLPGVRPTKELVDGPVSFSHELSSGSFDDSKLRVDAGKALPRTIDVE